MRFAHSFGARFATNGAAYGCRAVGCIPQTGLFFLGVAAVFMIVGAVLHAVAPQAVTLGEVWQHVRGRPAAEAGAR
jgi:hypothetical protein